MNELIVFQNYRGYNISAIITIPYATFYPQSALPQPVLI